MVPLKTGFRRFEIKDKIMLMNGERIIINGVNRHEWNPRRGPRRRPRICAVTSKSSSATTSMRCAPAIIRTRASGTGFAMKTESMSWMRQTWKAMDPGRKWADVNHPGTFREACRSGRPVWWTGLRPCWSGIRTIPASCGGPCGNESYAGTCILAMSRYFHEKGPVQGGSL